MDGIRTKKRVRVDSEESELAQHEVKRLREDLLDILDDSDICTTSQDLDAFMKSFEQEIKTSSSSMPATVVDDGESQPELGYLLEASDDELGLPPSETSVSQAENHVHSELARVTSDSSELRELWGFDEHISGYDSFGFGFDDVFAFNNSITNNGEYVALDGLFDYSDIGFGSSDFLWRPGTLPAQ